MQPFTPASPASPACLPSTHINTLGALPLASQAQALKGVLYNWKGDSTRSVSRGSPMQGSAGKALTGPCWVAVQALNEEEIFEEQDRRSPVPAGLDPHAPHADMLPVLRRCAHPVRLSGGTWMAALYLGPGMDDLPCRHLHAPVHSFVHVHHFNCSLPVSRTSCACAT